MNKESKRPYRKPSERAAGFVLGIFGWIKHIIGSTGVVIPPGRVIEHHGRELAPGRVLRYPMILLVEDNPDTAEDFIRTITGYYSSGSVLIFLAHTHEAAIDFFENEEISLVIMDADLDDEDGDGVDLTRRFLARKPHLPVLTNSSRKISNLKLTGFGAVESIGKNPEKLRRWLLQHDPPGAGE